jgi:HEAT repeat protein
MCATSVLRRRACGALLVLLSVAACSRAAAPRDAADVRAAAYAFLEGDREGARRLRAGLSSRDPDVRAWSAEMIGWAGVKEEKNALVSRLSDPAPEVRRGAAYSLGLLKAKENVADLCRLLSDPEPSVRTGVLFALGDIGDPSAGECLAPVLRSRIPREREFAARALAGCNSPVACRELCALLGRETNERVLQAVAESLGRAADPSAEGALLAKLESLSGSAKTYGIIALGRCAGDRGSAALLRWSRAGNLRERLAAVRAMGMARRPELLHRLARMAQDDPLPRVREFAGRAVRDDFPKSPREW